MADTTMPQVVRSYLAQLEKALAGLPAEIRDEIVAGIREELNGLNTGAAAARIEELGDPEFIAAEAKVEVGHSREQSRLGEPQSAVAPGAATPREPGWFPVLAALSFAIGGLIIPLYGWVIGLGLVWVSRSWTTREKLVGTAIGPVAVAIGALIVFLGEMSAGSVGPAGVSVPSAVYNAVVAQLRLLMLVNGVVGIWLAWRVSRRWWQQKS